MAIIFAYFSPDYFHQGGCRCRALENTYRIALRGSHALKTCRKPKLSSAVGIIRDDPAPGAVAVVIEIAPESESSMIWVIWSRSDRGSFISPTPSIIAVDVNVTLVRTRATWLSPRATTPTASSHGPCGWWWRTACLTVRPVGICGGITGSLFRLPPSKTGSKVGEKKAEQHVVGAYLDAVLAKFSGYIAADELYDGCFCVLSIVGNRTFRRLTYHVLGHDPTQADVESL